MYMKEIRTGNYEYDDNEYLTGGFLEYLTKNCTKDNIISESTSISSTLNSYFTFLLLGLKKQYNI